MSSALPMLVPSQVISSSKSSTKPVKQKSKGLEMVSCEQTEASLLVPAQVSVSSNIRKQQHQSSPKNGTGQSKKTKKTVVSMSTPGGLLEEVAEITKPSTTGQAKAKQDSTMNNSCRPNNNARRRSRQKNNKGRSKVVNRQTSVNNLPKYGNLPDIEWSSISMDHLRLHPRFKALPLPEHLPKLTTLEDCRYIRQDSWQWDALHDGRCTTSQAVAALGFLEQEAGQLLGVPSTWQRRGLSAYHRLQQPALRTLEEMNKVLLSENQKGNVQVKQQQSSNELWKETTTRKDGPFAATYLGKLSNNEQKLRKHRSISHSDNGMAIRMMWGTAQEATSVLTALNYFTQQDSNVVVKEIGMCGAGLALNRTDGTSPSSLLIGATPDAVIEYPNGDIEALEVKNHCPFVLSRPPRKKGVRHKRFVVRELPFATPYIFPLYVPQLQLEMNCLGPSCRSAVMVRQTATNGALILRMHRDDEWIEEMMYWLQRFQQDFVEMGEEPEANFFYNSPLDRPRYLTFLERTKEIANTVDLVDRIPQESIQRAHQDLPMFLD